MKHAVRFGSSMAAQRPQFLRKRLVSSTVEIVTLCFVLIVLVRRKKNTTYAAGSGKTVFR